MNNQQTDLITFTIFIPIVISFFIGMINLTVLRMLFLADKNNTKKGKFPYSLVGGEIGYISNLPEPLKSKYLAKIKTIKISFSVFAVCVLFFIAYWVVFK